MTDVAKSTFLDREALARILPFALFMALIGIEEGLSLAGSRGFLVLPQEAIYYLYPVKAVSVAVLLFAYRHSYQELNWRDLLSVRTTGTVTIVGILTFVMWIYTDWSFSVEGGHKGFNPTLLPDSIRPLMIATRVAGAVLVVPLMEELFWRSFLLRYLIDADFKSVAIGRFTWGSFMATTVLFGLEHQLIIAGMVAGAIYSITLYKTKSLAQCILAHAVTNLCLALYVLYTGSWYFW